MEKSSELHVILKELEKLLYGYNYVVEFGVNIFDNCVTKDDFQVALKTTYPKARPETVALLPVTKEEFYTEIESALDYRGDSGAGVEITGSKLEQFTLCKAALLNILQEWTRPDSSIFSYPDLMGLPGYPVWWDFRYIVFSNHSTAIFIFGSSSD